MQLSQSYLSLGEEFYKSSKPKIFPETQLILYNEARAVSLGLPKLGSKNEDDLAQLLAGQTPLENSQPAALAYSGHQFGQFNPHLGDGRAHYLGELSDAEGRLWELQLKGSGPTPFSRRGDGLCGLGPAVREFIMSAAMIGLKVPTTESLSVVTTGEKVFREGVTQGAVVSRLASSHIRVGSFQYFACRGNTDALKKLADFSLERHYPNIHSSTQKEAPSVRYTALLQAVMEKQIELITHWMRIGFIHGVMNTDNTSIAGETIDFGPCAMLGAYDPNTVYSSIDRQGRYAFSNQANIALWNLTRFAECLIPLIDSDDTDKAISVLEPILSRFSNDFSESNSRMMAEKLGLTADTEDSKDMAERWLTLLKEHQLDYTQSFNLLTQLSENTTPEKDEDTNRTVPEVLREFIEDWRTQLNHQQTDRQEISSSMRKVNPSIIPRNHLVEKAISESLNGDTTYAKKLVEAMASPYERSVQNAEFDELPIDGDRSYVTYCGT